MRITDYLRSLGGVSHLYANASNGYTDLLKMLVESAGNSRPNVIIPSYLPAKLYRASLAAGCHVKFLRVNASCETDAGELARLIDANTIAVLHVHYFGFPGRIDDIERVCRERSVFLIEDCALTMAASHNGRALGTIGDAALFSVRKMFLYSEGGILRMANAHNLPEPRYARRVRSLFSAAHFVKQKIKYGYVRLTSGRDPLRLFRVDRVGHMDFSQPMQLDVKMLSRLTQARLLVANVELAAAGRRANFQRIAAMLPRSQRIEPLYESLPAGVTPYSFPLRVVDGGRDALRETLLREGVTSGAGWPEAPFSDDHEHTKALAGSLLELPVHQKLTEAQLTLSIAALRRALGAS